MHSQKTIASVVAGVAFLAASVAASMRADDPLDKKPAAKTALGPKETVAPPVSKSKVEMKPSPEDDAILILIDGEVKLRIHASSNKGLLLAPIDNGDNIFFGKHAGEKITEKGQYNVAIGDFAGISNVTGNFNTHLGYWAGSRGTASRNTCLGAVSGTKISEGEDNTCTGYASGAHLWVGSRNTLIGSVAAGSLSDGSDNVMIGYGAGGLTSAGNANVYIGDNAGYRNAKGSGNVFIGHQAGMQESANNRLYIGNSAAAPLIYGEFDKTFLGVNGSLGIRADDRFMKDAAELKSVLPRVLKLQPVEYRMPSDAADQPKKIGLRSEEIEKEFPGLVTRTEPEAVGYVDHAGLGALTLQALREQQAQIDALKEQNAQLLKMIDELKSKNGLK